MISCSWKQLGAPALPSVSSQQTTAALMSAPLVHSVSLPLSVMVHQSLEPSWLRTIRAFFKKMSLNILNKGASQLWNIWISVIEKKKKKESLFAPVQLEGKTWAVSSWLLESSSANTPAHSRGSRASDGQTPERSSGFEDLTLSKNSP